MTVTAYPRDAEGSRLTVNVAALTTQVAAVSSPAHKAAMAASLDQAQRELVLHYLDTGRLTAASILSTMT